MVAVRIRLRRIGKRKQPQYRLVVAESAGPRDGRFIESIGQYNPRVDPPAVSIDEERALWWLQQGARPSDTAKAIMIRVGIWEKFTGEPAPVAPSPAAEQAAGVQEAAPGAPESPEAGAESAPAQPPAAEEEPAAVSGEAAEDQAEDTEETQQRAQTQ
jgi:small subunit ribosomal protein S16